MFIPSDNVYAKLHSAPVGLWAAPVQDSTAVLVAKLGTDTIKAIYRGAATFLAASVIHIDRTYVRCVGLKVCDDPVHPIAPFGPHNFPDDIEWLGWILRQPAVDIYFYDELARPVLNAICTFEDAKRSRETAEALEAPGRPYSGQDIALLTRAMDLFDGQGSCGQTESVQKFELRLRFSDLQTMIVAWPGVGQFALSQSDEGDGLEQSAHHLLEGIFPIPGTLFRKPQVSKDSGTRELTDLLGLESKTLFLFETKAVSVFNKHPEQPTARRVKNVMAQVKKGLNQLEGAIRQLRAGVQVVTLENNLVDIAIEEIESVHAIVLISSMGMDLNWKWITQETLMRSKQRNAFFHVFDLIELQQLAVRAGFARRLHSFLCKRIDLIIDSRNANIRATFLENEPKES
jgi:hypothetical protein